jgi:hypothetical protein
MHARALKAAGGTPEQRVDLAPWLALQEWLEHAEHRVVIPYAQALAEAIPPVAVRLRRDFGALLTLIQAHAMLHQGNRQRDPEGRIIADLDDYAAVYELVQDLIAEGVEATVSVNIRETVEAVARLERQHPGGVPLGALAAELGLDKSAASRRATSAIDRGYLRNDEPRSGRSARYFCDQPMPTEVKILPAPNVLAERCSIARCGGIGPSDLPSEAMAPNSAPAELAI